MDYKAVAKGLVMVVILSLLSMLLLTALLYFTALPESSVPRLAKVIQLASVLLGSTMAAKMAGVKGIWHGLSVAVLFYCVLIILNLVWIKAPFLLFAWLKTGLFLCASGVLGGMIGVGLSDQGQ